jgi:tetratricopeptide (TPR) repeat protein
MFFWLIRGHATEGLRWYEQTLKLPSVSSAAQSRALLGAAIMWFSQGELERARSGLAAALDPAHRTSDVKMVALAETMLGHVELAVRNVDQARDQFARSLERFRGLAIPWGIGHALSGMAWVALATGDVGQAERLLDEAAWVLRDAGPWFGSLNIQRRANLAVLRGNPDQAIALVRESLTRIRELHDRFAFVYALIPLAAAAVLKGDDAWAARILGARDAVTERTGVTVVDESAHDIREQAERDLRARLGPDRWARAYAAGRRISIDGLLQDIDRVVGQG